MNPQASPVLDAAAKRELRSEGRAGQYLTFALAGEEYGVPILQVREIIEFTRVTPVPMTAPWILGIINLRGNVVPVVDLAGRFGLEGADLSKRACIVIVEVENQEGLTVVGVQVDAVREVADLGEEQVQAPPLFGSRVAQESLLGVGQTGDGFALLLDMNRVFPVAQLGDLDPLRETEASTPATRSVASPSSADPGSPDARIEPTAPIQPADTEAGKLAQDASAAEDAIEAPSERPAERPAEEDVEPAKPRRRRRRQATD